MCKHPINGIYLNRKPFVFIIMKLYIQILCMGVVWLFICSPWSMADTRSSISVGTEAEKTASGEPATPAPAINGLLLAEDKNPLEILMRKAATWMYQIQALDTEGAVAALAATNYPLLVLEPGHNFNDGYPYDTQAIVNALKNTPNGSKRLLLAYIDIGQAEDYRNYWGDDWIAPTENQAGYPDFLVTVDPDGWSGNYPVAYWRQAWKDIWLGNSGIVATLARFGFDGIYLDWVEAYDDEMVMSVAENEGVEPATAMIQFVEELGAAGRSVTPGFLVVAQNAPFLIDVSPARYAAAIDALAVEDTWFHGAGDADWDSPGAGDLPNRYDDEWSTKNRLIQYQKYQARNIPVFSVDYCISTTNAAQVYTDARTAGLIPLVTRVSLCRLTVTPPWDY